MATSSWFAWDSGFSSQISHPGNKSPAPSSVGFSWVPRKRDHLWKAQQINLSFKKHRILTGHRPLPGVGSKLFKNLHFHNETLRSGARCVKNGKDKPELLSLLYLSSYWQLNQLSWEKHWVKKKTVTRLKPQVAAGIDSEKQRWRRRCWF